MDNNTCRYCRRHNHTDIDQTVLQLNSLPTSQILFDLFKKFSKSRKTGACEDCIKSLDVISDLKDLLQVKQKVLRQHVLSVPELEISVKLEEEDDEYKDPLICIEKDSGQLRESTNETVHDTEADEACDLCGLTLPINQLKLHIEHEHTKLVAPKSEEQGSSSESDNTNEEQNPQDFLQVEMEYDDKNLAEKEELLQIAKETGTELEDGRLLLQCPVCNKNFIGAKNLKRHLALALHEKKKKRIYKAQIPKREPVLFRKCEYCPKEFGTRAIMRKHLRNVHKVVLENVIVDRRTEPRYICHFCNLGVVTRKAIQQHIQYTHLGLPKRKKQFYCDKCKQNISVINKIDFQRHYYKCKEILQDDVHQCCQCQEIFETESHLRFHFDTIHGKFPEDTSINKRRKYMCVYCRKKFVKRNAVVLHCKDKNFKEGLSNFSEERVCEECGLSFLNRDTFTNHKLRHKEEYLVPLPNIYNCSAPGCTKIFPTLRALNRHQRYHKKGNQHCDLCDAVFFHREQINRHMRNYHKNGEQLTCTECSTIFVSFEQFTKHNYDHKKFECEHCHKRFVKQKDCRYHVLRFHEKPDAEKICKHCQKSYVMRFKKSHPCFKKKNKPKTPTE